MSVLTAGGLFTPGIHPPIVRYMGTPISTDSLHYLQNTSVCVQQFCQYISCTVEYLDVQMSPISLNEENIPNDNRKIVCVGRCVSVCRCVCARMCSSYSIYTFTIIPAVYCDVLQGLQKHGLLYAL